MTVKLITRKFKKTLRTKSGLALIQALILITVISGLLLTIVTLTLLGLNISKQGVRQTATLDIAEAGINYYLWHLVHDPADYCDGETCPAGPGPYGPYEHDYTDSSGNVIGTFTLWIAPPEISEGGKVTVCHVPGGPVTLTIAPSAVEAHLAHGDSLGSCEGGGGGGSTVTVESRGDVVDGNENRTIVATLGIPSFAQYAVVANDTSSHIRFGDGTEVFGPIHNNGGVRFDDGEAHGLVSSAMATYNDPDPPYDNASGVHTHEPDPSQVFLGGTSFPVPQVDFDQITADLSAIKDQATSDGYYYAPSGANGYHIVLKEDDTYDIYSVTSVTASCNTSLGWQATYGITSETIVDTNRPFPNNGVIFVEDDLWVEGKINEAELTIATGRFPDIPATNTNIYINNDIEYTNMDGKDKIGLIAQNNISVGLYSEGSFTGGSDEQELLVHAALLAQNGRVGRNYYPRQWWWWTCDNEYWHRNKITVYGSIGTAKRYGFAWICDGNPNNPPWRCAPGWTIEDWYDSGYQYRDLIYDQNLSAGPPPSWPTIGNYAILDWRER